MDAVNVMGGVYLWVWNLRNCEGGDLAAIAQRVKSAGAAGVILKASDGNTWFDQGQPVSAVIPALEKLGCRCATWSYHYGQDVAGEAQRVNETIAVAPAFHVLDIEQEVEDLPNPSIVADQLVQAIAANNPANVPLCYAPLPAIRYHLRLPYRQLTDAGLTMLPQLYWTGIQWSVAQTVAVFYGDATQYDLLTQPVFPAYEDAAGARATAADVATFVAAIQAQGAAGCSVWSYEALDAGGWERVALAAAAFAPVAPPADPCVELRQELTDAQANVVALSGEITALAAKISAAVAALQ